jgi:hypothetical protein
MNHTESALAGLFDFEHEDPAAAGRRQAPDWGGDDLFTSMPRRRRFERAASADRGAEHADRTLRAAAAAGTARSADGIERAPRAADGALRFRRDTMEHPVQHSQRPPVSTDLDGRSPLELPDVTERTVALPETTAAPVVPGRRTVTITGHPDRVPARRRPAPSIDERLYGSNPERIAMYAFALGLLLIVVALLSANA